jgi:hypothetical protein
VRQAANGTDAVPNLRPLAASGDFDDYRAYHSGKNTSAPSGRYRDSLSLAA